MLFSGVLVGVVLLGLRFALGASRTAGLDPAELGTIGDTLFNVFCVVQLGMAMVLAPLSTASAIVEERTDRTFDLLVLTRLRPSQIFGGKVLSRILVLLTVVLGAQPVLALVVNFGGVSTTEVVVLTGHTLVNVLLMGLLGAFFGLFTRSPLLAMMASNAYALPFFVLLPFCYAALCGDAATATHFSTLSAFLATDLWGLLPALGFLPAMVLMVRLAAPLFELSISGADFDASLSNELWRISRGVMGFVVWAVLALVTFPFAGPLAWEVHQSGTVDWSVPVDAALHAAALVWLFGMFSVLNSLGTWAFLRVTVDVVDGIDGIFTRPVTGDRLRKSGSLGTYPVWWREARLRAWASSAAPILVTWGLVLLAVFQTGTWLAPGVLLAIGVGNTLAVLVLTAWLASRAIAEERRKGTLEILLVTTIQSSQVVFGKAAGAALPTLPLMLIGLPMLAFGYAYVDAVGRLARGESFELPVVIDGAAMWWWAVPVWAFTNVLAMTLAARLPNPRSAFGLSVASMAAVLGWTPLVGRMFPDLPVLGSLARLVAPPLAGGASGSMLLVSMALWTVAVIVGFVALSRNLRGWIGGVLAVVVAFGLATPRLATAQPSRQEIAALEAAFGLRVTAVPLADGLSRDGRWTSVRVMVENRGPAVDGDLSWTEPTIDGERRFTRELSIPERGRKVVDLPVLTGPNPQARGLWFEGGGRQAATVLQFVPIGDDDVVIGFIGRDPLGLPAAVTEAWSGAVPRRAYPAPTYDDPSTRLVRTGLMPEATLPSFAAGYDALDWVVWPSADPSRLSAEQLRALLDWVADGGHLLVSVTESWRAVGSSPLGEALPVTLQGIAEVELAPLAAALAEPSPGRPGAAPAARGVLRTDRVALGRAWSNEGQPLWAIGAFGLGSIHVLLADPAVQPLADIDRRTMWRRLLHLPARHSSSADLGPLAAQWTALQRMLHLVPDSRDESMVDDYQTPKAHAESPIRDWLSDIPNLAPLPIEWLAAFGGLYLLWIGPIDYFVLRAIGRQTWTWITFPVVIVIFSTLALVGAAQQKGSQAMLLRIERVDVLPDAGRLRGDTWFGLFSTRRATLTVGSARGGGLVQPLEEAGFMNAPHFHTDGGPVVLSYGAETWSIGYSRSRWMTPFDGRIDVEWQEDGRPIVTNELGFELSDAVLVSPGGARFGIGPMGMGQRSTYEDGRVIDDALDLSIDTAFDRAVDRGGLPVDGRWWFIGLMEGFEQVRVDGLSPREIPRTVIRQVLEESVPAQRPIITVMVDPADRAHWARLVCADQSSVVRVRGGQARIPLPLGFDRELAGDAACRLEIAPPLSGWYSGVPVSLDRPNLCTVTDRGVACEPTP